MKYLITKSELKKVFGNTSAFKTLTTSQQDEAIESLYQTQTETVSRFVDYYTNEAYKHTTKLKEGMYKKTSFTEWTENETIISQIVTEFSSQGEDFALVIKAAKVDNYWKLISWIEVEER